MKSEESATIAKHIRSLYVLRNDLPQLKTSKPLVPRILGKGRLRIAQVTKMICSCTSSWRLRGLFRSRSSVFPRILRCELRSFIVDTGLPSGARSRSSSKLLYLFRDSLRDSKSVVGRDGNADWRGSSFAKKSWWMSDRPFMLCLFLLSMQDFFQQHWLNLSVQGTGAQK
jgi:hypothetical protein